MVYKCYIEYKIYDSIEIEADSYDEAYDEAYRYAENASINYDEVELELEEA